MIGKRNRSCLSALTGDDSSLTFDFGVMIRDDPVAVVRFSMLFPRSESHRCLVGGAPPTNAVVARRRASQ